MESPMLSSEGLMAHETRATRCGRLGSSSFRLFLCRNTADFNLVSPWHDIQLFSSTGSVSFVCTSPAASFFLLEPSENESFNPLRPSTRRRRQSGEWSNLLAEDTTSDVWAGNCWNTGMLPQTLSTHGGRTRPLEMIEVGLDQERFLGESYLVKPLGACCVEEDGEMVWRVLGVAENDSLTDFLHSIEDIDVWLPGLLRQLQRWCSAFSRQQTLLTLSAIHLSQTLQKVCESHYQWQLKFGVSAIISPKSKAILATAELPAVQENHTAVKMASTDSASEDRKLPGNSTSLRSSFMKLFLPRSCTFVATVSTMNSKSIEGSEELHTAVESHPFWRRLSPKAWLANRRQPQTVTVAECEVGVEARTQAAQRAREDRRNSLDSNLIEKTKGWKVMWKKKAEMDNMESSCGQKTSTRKLTRSNTSLQERVLRRSLTEWK